MNETGASKDASEVMKIVIDQLKTTLKDAAKDDKKNE
jgi:hypothetical protein